MRLSSNETILFDRGLKEEKEYWLERLGKGLEGAQLPPDHVREQSGSPAKRDLDVTLSADLREQFGRISKGSSFLVYAALHAAVKLVISRYARNETVVVGSPVLRKSGQHGCNVVSVVDVLSPDQTFRDVLLQVRQTLLDAYARQRYPFGRLVRDLGLELKDNRCPLFDVVVAHAELHGDLPVLDEDLLITLHEAEGDLLVRFAFRPDVFDEATIYRLSAQVLTLLERGLTDPTTAADALSLLSDTDRHRFLVELNQTGADLPQMRCLHDWFEDQVARTPDVVAAIVPSAATAYRDGVKITYAELDRRATSLAAQLRQLGVAAEVRVAIYMQRSIEMLVGVLATLKSGGTYVPIDPAYPLTRVTFILKDSGAEVVITDHASSDKLPDPSVPCLVLEPPDVPPDASPEPVPHRSTDPDNAAYIIYTSGSTGRPKGVVVPHRGVCNLIHVARGLFALEPGERVLQQASLAFDASVLEIFVTLCSGGTLCLVDRTVLLSQPDMGRLLVAQRVNAIVATPALLEVLPRDPLPDLRVLTTGGEACSAELANAWSRERRLINVYAPTEASIFCTAHECSGTYDRVPPIGRPIPNTRIYVLDRYGQPVAPGVPGEIHLGGIGLARGYLGAPDLTAQRFVPDPFGEEPGGRLYRTGDLARFLSDGSLEFCGRVDDQVKIRGFRIELGEVETVLRSHARVREAVALARTDGDGGAQLVAYVVPRTDDAVIDAADDEDFEAGHVSHWKVLYDETYREAQPSNPEFDITGWNSSYTKLPIPDQEMCEWLDGTVDQVMELEPKKVLEIGCGSGLLLYRVAPRCELYTATDQSEVPLRRLGRDLRTNRPELGHVNLMSRMADDFEGLETAAYDTVILNSVVQYFPSANYLIRVLEGAIRCVADGGAIFLGDVRSLPMLETLHRSLQLHGAPAALRSQELVQLAREAAEREEELVVDPELFFALRHHLPRIGQVEILPKRGRSSNELSRYRYQVVLRVGPSSATERPERWLDWSDEGLTVEELRRRLANGLDRLALSNIPNARLSVDYRLAATLGEAAPRTLGELRVAVASHADPDDVVEPDDLLALGDDAYDVDVSFAGHGSRGVLHATYTRRGLSHTRSSSLVPGSEVQSPLPWDRYANNPLESQAEYGLSARLRPYVQERLPEAMVPSAIVELEALPRTSTGKIDKKALPTPESSRRTVEAEYVAPRSALERRITSIWQQALGLERIGIHDNFFDLGGHSLLMVRVHAKLRAAFPTSEIALVELFNHTTVEALARRLDDTVAESDPTVESERSETSIEHVVSGEETDIAVVAMSVRLPGANSPEELWELVRDGREGIHSFSVDDLVEAGMEPDLVERPDYVRAGGVLRDVDLFDAGFFGYSAREAQMMDPQQRVFLEGAWEVLERAGCDPETFPGLIGVFAGLSMNTYLMFNLLSNRPLLEQMGAFQTMLGNSNDLLTTRVSYHMNLRGPSINVQTGCSTSLVAVHLARQSLLRGECDVALAGGVAILIPQEQGYSFVEGGVTSPDGHCRPFDHLAQGTVPGRGMGIVALKRLPDAVCDGDTIYAVVKGTAINNDGSNKVGYTAPSVQGQAHAIGRALSDSGVDPRTIGYVEAHGTATAIGDPIELTALTNAFRTYTSDREFAALGSVKANLGHPDTASGITGFIKAVLALHHRTLPPLLHFDRSHSNFDLSSSPFYINTSPVDWRSNGAVRRAAVNSLGIGGTNAHAILEEAPTSDASGPSRCHQLLVVSAKTAAALDDSCRQLAQYLQGSDQVPLADVAHTLRVGRRAFPKRRIVVCEDAGAAIEALEGRAPNRSWSTDHDNQDRPVAFMFPGQGAQYVGMGADLYESEPTFRDTIDRCAEILLPILDLDLRTLLFADASRTAEASETLRQTWVTQPALFTIEYALANLWIHWGVTPQSLCGHSIGEYVAACMAGVFSLEDALALVADRGRLMQLLPPGAMVAVALSEPEVESWLDDQVSLAAVNGPRDCVLAGTIEAIDRLEQRLASEGVQSARLRTSHAFHSWMVEPILEQFAERVARISLSPPNKTLVSCVTGAPISAEQATDPAYWTNHIRSTVRFGDAVSVVLSEPEQILLEVGPGQVLLGLARQSTNKRDGHVLLSSLRRNDADVHDVEFLLRSLGRLWLSGLRVDWSRFVEGERRKRIVLPTYPFERRRYWIDLPTKGTTGASLTMDGVVSSATRWCSSAAWREQPFVERRSEDPRVLWRIVAPAGSFGARLAQMLEAEGADVELVDPMTLAEHRSEAGVGIDGRPIRIIDASAVGRVDDDDCSMTASRLAFVVALAQTGRADAEQVVELFIIADGVHAIAQSDGARPVRAGLVGLCGVLDRAEGRTRVIDTGPVPPTNSWQDKRLLQQLVAEVRTGTDTLVAYRGKQRWVQESRPVESPRFTSSTSGTYLFAGDLSTDSSLLIRHHLGRPGVAFELDADVTVAEGAVEILQATGAEVTLAHATGESQAETTSSDSACGDFRGAILTLPPFPTASNESDATAHLRRAQSRLEQFANTVRDSALEFCVVQVTSPSDSDVFAVGVDAAVFQMARAVAHNQTSQTPTQWVALGLRDDRTGPPGTEAIVPAIAAEFYATVLQSQLAGVTASMRELYTAGQSFAEPEDVAGAGMERLLATEVVGPRNEIEARLIGIWRQFLGFEEIGVFDDFFELGGQSLLATQVMNRIRGEFQTEIPMKRFFEAPTVAGLAERVASEDAEGPQLPPLEPADRNLPLPLSFAQQRMWFLSQMQPGTAVYNVPNCIRFEGPLDVELLGRSLREIVARHEVLRTTFVVIDGDPVQQIADRIDVEIPVVDLTSLPIARRDEAMRDHAEEEARRPFDLEKGPLLRASLVRLAEADHVVSLTMHHIVADGWSRGVLLRELGALYEAFAAGEPSPLPPLPIQYADFAVWQRSWLDGDVLQHQLSFWKDQLGDLPPPAELPLDRPRPAANSFRGAGSSFSIPREHRLHAMIARVRKEEDATLFMVLLTSLGALIHRYTGAPDVVVGSPIANRTRNELEGLVGYFVNTLALRVDASGSPTFRELLKRVRESTRASFDHQDLPFERLIDELGVARDPSRSPLFNVSLILQNTAMGGGDLSEVTLSGVQIDKGTAQFDQSWYFAENEDGLSCTVEYNSDLFDECTVVRMTEHFCVLLEGMIDSLDCPLAFASLIGPSERTELLGVSNGPADDVPEVCLHDLFEAMVDRDRLTIALLFADQRVTYGELEGRANRLANHLRSRGLGRGDVVGVCLERGPELVTAIVATLKAGAAYLPLDPSLPAERLRFMAAEASARVVITRDRHTAVFADSPTVHVDGHASLIERSAETRPMAGVAGRDLAYVIFTSGSTGAPKGVAVEHHAVVNLALAQIDAFQVSETSRILQFASIGFDASVSEIFTALTAGAALCLGDGKAFADLGELERVLCEQEVTVTTLPPSVLAVIPSHRLPKLSTVVSAGERCSAAIVERWATGRRFLNAYGPTEAAVCATIGECQVKAGDPLIGTPIRNMQVYVLDEALQPAAYGVPGEIYLGGEGVARGYLANPGLTAERFIPDPFTGEPGGRLYRTGDRGRYRKDGELEFLGRTDRQVKLRGYRIELDELEVALAGEETIREAVVELVSDRAREASLVAYVVAHDPTETEPPTDKLLRERLARWIPGYMLPSRFVWLDELPRLSSGKVDHAALPATPVIERVWSGLPVTTDAERALADVWRDLGLVSRGAEDDFFELGGHSMLVVKLVHAIETEFGVELPIAAIFATSRLRDLAAVIERAQSGGGPSPTRGIDLVAEATLEPDIASSAQAPSAGAPEHLFVTGATGFVGSSIVAELLARTNARITCLVRASSGTGWARLRERLAWFEQLSSDPATNARIDVVEGDLRQPRLGLGDSEFEALAGAVDAIVHAGAEVNLVYPYEALAAANVGGTREILRLAARGRPKVVHYVSTLSLLDACPTLPENALPDVAGIDTQRGYEATKWVSERLISMARERGLSCNLYRIGRAGGHSTRGTANSDDLWFRMIKGCVELGAAPQSSLPLDLAPVDYITRAVVRGITHGEPGQSFHVVGPRVTWSRVVAALREFGYPIIEVPFDEWIRRAQSVMNGGISELAPFVVASRRSSSLLHDQRESDDHAEHATDTRNLTQLLEGTGIRCPEINEHMLHVTFSYLVRAGLLTPPGRERLESDQTPQRGL